MTYKVTYFETSGRGEPIRFLLAYGGANFEDNRVPKADWPALKSDTPFGQLPVLEHEGKTAHQTTAICRYLGKQFKLAGKNDWEDLEIDAAVDTFTDLQKVMRANKGATGKDTLQHEEVKYFLKTLDEQIRKNNGYIALSRLTWADLFVASFALAFLNINGNKDLFADYPNLNENIKKVQNLPKIKEWISKHPPV